MKKEDLTLIGAVVIVAAVFAFVVSSMLFKSNNQTSQVPVVESINSNMPDPYNDPTLKTIFNSNAIDPTQTTQIGNQKNNSPFTGATP